MQSRALRLTRKLPESVIEPKTFCWLDFLACIYIYIYIIALIFSSYLLAKIPSVFPVVFFFSLLSTVINIMGIIISFWSLTSPTFLANTFSFDTHAIMSLSLLTALVVFTVSLPCLAAAAEEEPRIVDGGVAVTVGVLLAIPVVILVLSIINIILYRRHDAANKRTHTDREEECLNRDDGAAVKPSAMIESESSNTPSREEEEGGERPSSFSTSYGREL